MPIWQREKAAELAALKLVRNKLEEHVGSFVLFDLDQNRSALVNCCPEITKTTRALTVRAGNLAGRPEQLLLFHHFR